MPESSSRPQRARSRARSLLLLLPLVELIAWGDLCSAAALHSLTRSVAFHPSSPSPLSVLSKRQQAQQTRLGFKQLFQPSLAAAGPSLKQHPIVILPGFGNDALDYTNPMKMGEDTSLKAALERRGYNVYVVPIARREWLSVARDFLTRRFWTGECRPDGPGFRWYLDRVRTTVDRVRRRDWPGGALPPKVVLVGHSAGGWLARAVMGDGTWRNETDEETGESTVEYTQDIVQGVISLGSPHYPPPPPALDMTRGVLTYVCREYPGTFHKEKGIFYVSVVGDAVTGDVQADRGTLERFAFQSYEVVCGSGDGVRGDGVVPLRSAYLDGSRCVTMSGVYHSINVPDSWYGSENVVDTWLAAAQDELQQMTTTGREGGKGSGAAERRWWELFSDWPDSPTQDAGRLQLG
ncbi:unnamed protein product [Vitrella brassicaformis CCMP3155]|uniref:AB hydrolase-1 domain-containing protein n=2 Tax=Vitrella brassicaformis TaxID=1169539 RepID=A0A0G4FYU4_VITBC|nr:unnamed protein product [Vitrella brassicaformis CCMP3155]|eukprot:CEM20650.1 unnamed protein product [Vitrella brassicaformis CCMP3155]